MAILAAIDLAGVATDAQIAEETDLSKGVARRERQALVAEGLVEAVPSEPGAHYPIAGWRVVR